MWSLGNIFAKPFLDEILDLFSCVHTEKSQKELETTIYKNVTKRSHLRYRRERLMTLIHFLHEIKYLFLEPDFVLFGGWDFFYNPIFQIHQLHGVHFYIIDINYSGNKGVNMSICHEIPLQKKCIKIF